MLPHQICREFLQALTATFREFALYDDVLTLEITEFLQLPYERCDEKSAGACIEQPYFKGLLRPRVARRQKCHASEKCDESSSLHVIHGREPCAIPKDYHFDIARRVRNRIKRSEGASSISGQCQRTTRGASSKIGIVLIGGRKLGDEQAH
jgi:hypothetical protein